MNIHKNNYGKVIEIVIASLFYNSGKIRYSVIKYYGYCVPVFITFIMSKISFAIAKKVNLGPLTD